MCVFAAFLRLENFPIAHYGSEIMKMTTMATRENTLCDVSSILSIRFARSIRSYARQKPKMTAVGSWRLQFM